MSETPEERARRLGLIPSTQAETPEQRAQRLGLGPAHSALSPRELMGNANKAVTEAEVDEASQPTYAQQALGGVAAMARDIPGAETAQAGLRSLVRRQPYSEALSDIRGAEDTAPTAVRVGNRLVGTTVATLALPKGLSAMGRGALYGALRGGLEADPESVGTRAVHAAEEGAAGGVLGRLFTPSRRAIAGETPIGALGRKMYPTAKQDVSALAGAGRRLASGTRKLFLSPPSAVADEAAPAMSGDQARSQLAKLLQQKLDEGGAGNYTPEAFAAREGVPLDVETSPDLMAQIEQSLLKAKGATAPRARPAPLPSPTANPSLRSVADVLRNRTP
jgi:hypothetical protein